MTTEPVQKMNLDPVIYVAGHLGMVGSAVWRQLSLAGFNRLVGWSSSEVDLRDRAAVRSAFESVRPDFVIDAAAKVGGILANATRPTEFLSENLRIQLNLLDAAHEFDVERFVFLGSSCIYPRLAEQPIPESALMTGPLEPTNKAYAIAKIAGIAHVQALRHEFGRRYIAVMPTNLYGPNDNFDLGSAHVLPALMRRFHIAASEAAPEVVLWGTGRPRREFLHVDDLASAIIHLLFAYDSDEPINVGTGKDIQIRDLATRVSETVGFKGAIRWDASRPDGTPRKLLDISRILALGWHPKITLDQGIRETYRWFRSSGQ